MKKTTFYKAIYNNGARRFDLDFGYQETYTAANGQTVDIIYHHAPGGKYWMATEKSTGFRVCGTLQRRADVVEYVTGKNPVQILRAVNVRPQAITPKQPAGMIDKIAERLQYMQQDQKQLADYIASLEEVPACIS